MSCDVISYVLSVSLGPQQLVQLFSCVDQVVLYVWTQFTLIPFDVDLSNLTRQAITEIRRFLHGGRPPTSRVLIVSGCFIAGICALSRAFLLFGISNWTLNIWKENTTLKSYYGYTGYEEGKLTTLSHRSRTRSQYRPPLITMIQESFSFEKFRDRLTNGIRPGKRSRRYEDRYEDNSRCQFTDRCSKADITCTKINGN